MAICRVSSLSMTWRHMAIPGRFCLAYSSVEGTPTEGFGNGLQVGQFEGIIQHCLSTGGVHVIDLPINYAVSAQLQVSIQPSLYIFTIQTLGAVHWRCLGFPSALSCAYLYCGL